MFSRKDSVSPDSVPGCSLVESRDRKSHETWGYGVRDVTANANEKEARIEINRDPPNTVATYRKLGTVTMNNDFLLI
jgi:hypothetical protein